LASIEFRDSLEGVTHRESLDRAREMFLAYLHEAMRGLGGQSDNQPYIHGDDDRFDPPEPGQLLEMPWRSIFHRWTYRDLFIQRDLESLGEEAIASVSAGSTTAYDFAAIRKSAARDAINAISLANVVEALRARVTNDQPSHSRRPTRRFVWRSESKRFEGGGGLSKGGLEITLLGPSEGLVRKHWNRLPIGSYAALARLAVIPIKGVTPSNQLSYVMRIR
jgi:hypothetical protein